MSEIESLANRFDDEFAAVEKKVKAVQAALVQECREHRKRLARLGEVFQRLAEAWKPGGARPLLRLRRRRNRRVAGREVLLHRRGDAPGVRLGE